MKQVLILITITLLSGCASIRRYNVGAKVSANGCSHTIEQILSSTNYRVSGCGYDHLNYSEIE